MIFIDLVEWIKIFKVGVYEIMVCVGIYMMEMVEVCMCDVMWCDVMFCLEYFNIK